MITPVVKARAAAPATAEPLGGGGKRARRLCLCVSERRHLFLCRCCERKADSCEWFALQRAAYEHGGERQVSVGRRRRFGQYLLLLHRGEWRPEAGFLDQCAKIYIG